MSADDAAALFLDRARLVQPGLREPEGGSVEEICRLADGLPLAVELAAARARTLSVPAIRDGMADRLRFLAARDPRAATPYRSLRASLDRSVELAGGAARQALAALSVVDGRFPLDVALALTGGDRDVVETLVEHSLVQFDAADHRYLLLDTVRDYAAADLVAADTAAPAHRRLIDWAVAFAAEIRTGLERADPEALRRADACDGVVTSALQRAVAAGRGADGAAVAADLAFAWSLRGRCAEGLAQVRRLEAALDPVPPPLRWAHAFLAAYSGEMESRFAVATVAAEESAADGDDRSRARALTLQGMVLQFADPAAAEGLVTEAATLAEHAGDDWCRVEALQMLAYTHLLRADLPAALAAADAAGPTLDRLGHPQLRAWDAAIRAEVAGGQGRFAEAQTWGYEGLRLAVDVGEPVSALGCLVPLLRTLVATGRAAEAEAVLDGHREFFRTHPGMAPAESIALATAIVAAEADPEQASCTAESALTQVTPLGQAWYAAEAADLVAVARLRNGDPHGARHAAREAAGGHSGSGTAASPAGRHSRVRWPSTCWVAPRATCTPRSPMPRRSGCSRWSPTGWRSWPPSPRTRTARSSPLGCGVPPDVCASSWPWPRPRWSGCWTPPSSRSATRHPLDLGGRRRVRRAVAGQTVPAAGGLGEPDADRARGGRARDRGLVVCRSADVRRAGRP